jgi:hypothetical protein
MTGAGKSVIVADLLAQIGHRFGFRLIVEEGLSHAVLTQTQGCGRRVDVFDPDNTLGGGSKKDGAAAGVDKPQLRRQIRRRSPCRGLLGYLAAEDVTRCGRVRSDSRASHGDPDISPSCSRHRVCLCIKGIIGLPGWIAN